LTAAGFSFRSSNPFDSFCLFCVFNQIDTLSLFASFPLAVFRLFAFAFKLHWKPKFENDSLGFSAFGSVWELWLWDWLELSADPMQKFDTFR